MRFRLNNKGEVCFYDYREHKILPKPKDPLHRYELLVEVAVVSNEFPKEIKLLLFEKPGTEKEMEKLWISFCKKNTFSKPEQIES